MSSTYEEAEKYVFPFLTHEQIKLSKRFWQNQTSEEASVKKDYLCFLVSKDLNYIAPMAWYYPISGHWTGCSPFVSISEIEVIELEELRNIVL